MALVVSLNHLGDEVDPDQLVVNKELSVSRPSDSGDCAEFIEHS